MRKLYILFLIAFLFCIQISQSFAQNVGIGTIAPSPNAILHLENNSSNLGLLLPNVDISLFLPSPLVTDEGMMVYDSTLDQIYTWDGTAWQTPGGGSFWNLNGNAGTNDAVNFIGTTDGQDLVFRTNNFQRMRIDVAGRAGFNIIPLAANQFSIATSTSDQGLGVNNSRASASSNTGIRGDASNSTSVNNGIFGNAFGAGSTSRGVYGTSGTAATAIGVEGAVAGAGVTTAYGIRGAATSTGTDNYGVYGEASGGTNNYAGYFQGNSVVTGNLGVGTINPANRLEVIGDAAKFDSVIIVNNAQAGYVLTAADATGAASWQPTAGGVSGTGAANKLAYWTAANTLAFNSGLHYESGNQRLGIGTAAPAEFLHVNSGNPITVASRFTNATTGFTGSDGFGFGITGTGNAFINNDEATPINISTASTTRMTIGATGNIGIGNNAPNAPLQFATALANRKIVLFEGANNDHQYFGFGVNGAALRYQVNGTFASHIFYASVNTTTSNELMRIVGDGNVGIGVSAPSERLHISSSAGSTGMVITNDFLGTTATDGLLIGISGSNAVTINNRENGPLLLGTNGLPNINQLVLDPSGNVGLNITPPTERLHVNGNLRLAGAFMPNNLPGAAGDVLISSGAGTAPTWGSAPASVGTGTINRLTYWNTSSSIASGSNLGWNNALEYLGVGIGLPERPLHLHRASADDVFAKFTNTVSFIGAGNGFEIGLSSSNEVLLRHYENTSMRFYTNNAERMTIDGSGNLGFGTPPVAGNRITARIGSSSGTTGYFENSISGINGNALTVINSGTRSIGHNGMLVQNLVTKAGGSNSTKIGLKVESTGSWGPGTTNQPNVGIDVTVSGADDNYAAILNGGNVGIGTSSPSAALDVDGGGSIEIDGEYTYENPKIHYEFLNAAQFRSINAQEEFRLNGPFTDNATDVYGYFTGSASAQYAHAMAQVHLPNGAQITNMTAYVFDNEPNGLVWDQARVALRRQGTDIGGAGSSNLGLINFAVNNGTAIQTQGTAISETVDNNQFMYTVTYIADRFSGTNQRLYGVKITYTVDQAD